MTRALLYHSYRHIAAGLLRNYWCDVVCHHDGSSKMDQSPIPSCSKPHKVTVVLPWCFCLTATIVPVPVFLSSSSPPESSFMLWGTNVTRHITRLGQASFCVWALMTACRPVSQNGTIPHLLMWTMMEMASTHVFTMHPHKTFWFGSTVIFSIGPPSPLSHCTHSCYTNMYDVCILIHFSSGLLRHLCDLLS